VRFAIYYKNMATLNPQAIDGATAKKLRRLNIYAAILHFGSAIAILSLTNSFSLPIIANYIQGDPGTAGYQTIVLGHDPVGLMCALFLFLSAVAHLWIASNKGFGIYLKDLSHNRNIARWVEYSISSSIMIVLIAQLSSIRDIITLAALFFTNVSMILFGWLQEKYEAPGGGMLPFWFGCIAGIVPWAAIVFLLIAPGETSGAHAPGFVYGIIVTLFIFFNCFALNQYFQYCQVGKWKDYLYGERVYITLSFVAKSALAWQIFAGALAQSH